LGNTYDDLGRRAEAEPLLRKSLEGLEVVFGEKHPNTLISRSMLGILCRNTGRLAEAEHETSETYRLRRSVLGELHPATLSTQCVLAGIYVSQGRHTDAEPLLRDFREKVRRQQGRLPPFTIRRIAEVGHALLQQGDFTEAESFLRLYLDIAGRKLPEGWRRFDATAALGASLLGQKKFAEAEPVLLKGYAGLRQYEERIPSYSRQTRLTEALDALVRLYEETNKPNEATKWRQEATKVAARSAASP